ncbi:TPA: hypothetical protein UL576_005509 [Klebsiella pneumoniae]|uniref:hypothetical protein n=1 Tax=Enterobacteriaceae TaxID=543 RepID=UPI000BFB3293|nr:MULTISPECIES: hypothetical protein [Enterobacteriaceae]EKV3343465.1 hypothetical protein [Klebsiella pneumoniae]HCL5784989.1 hypothetical protein [Citrobacter freundii]HDS6013064.1 hypothetical protein [Klebsiella variicola]EMB5617040.1 hypothetical protein [Klebsiella pneumoniae]MBG2605319.1 hypothetical protein [Klebsiella oxytoca]
MSEIATKPFAELSAEEKENRFSSLSKVALKSLRGSFNLDETEKQLKSEVGSASEKVNLLSKKLANGEEHNREEYSEAVKDLNKASRKLDKFLDSYEELRDGTGDKLKELRNFLDELIGEITDEQVL